nr:hypothetical protein BaRGS_000365 [Batillaria attramentaria]
MALEGLRNVIKGNPGVEIQCIGHFKLLFALLRLENCGRMQQFTLEVLNCVTANHECVKDIAAAEVLGYLLFALYSVQQCQLLALDTLFALMSNTKIVKEALAKGALIYLLDLFCNATNPAVREKTAELLAKMLADKLVGPKVRIILTKFLPGIFMDAMRDSAEASVHMFEGSHENPELIWNDEAREKVCDTVKKLRKSHFQQQKENTEAKWGLREDYAVVYSDVQGEVVIGGVFLRLFISNPGWVLRRPKEFMTELLEKWAQLTGMTNPDGEMLETVTTALVCLCSTQPTMLDHLPQLGYINKVFNAMSNTTNNAIPKSAIQVAHQMANSELCVRSLVTFDCIGPLKMGMKARRDMIALAAEMLAKMFDKGEDELVAQALKADLVPFLLRLLEGGLEAVDNPAATKAQIVKALKAMQRSLQHGERVTEILDKSPVWKEYRDQRHDLFISDSNISGYLTGQSGRSKRGWLLDRWQYAQHHA